MPQEKNIRTGRAHGNYPGPLVLQMRKVNENTSMALWTAACPPSPSTRASGFEPKRT